MKNDFMNYCFTCEKAFATNGSLNKHFQSKKHETRSDKNEIK
jgi:hypothetical protein